MSLKFFLKHKESLKNAFVKISEELILKLGNSLRNNVVRCPEELITKDRDGLRDGSLRLLLIKLLKKITFAMITEELVL